MRLRVKVCCMQDEGEIALAVRWGADAVGLVGRGLSGPEVIEDDARIAALVRVVPPPVAPVLLTREADPDVLVARVQRCGAPLVQLCDAVPPEAWAALRRWCPAVRILQVVHVTGEQALDEARQVAPHVDAVLLDSGAPAGPNPVFGGTGRTHDWATSARIVAALDKPVWLAGGLNADNLAEAVSMVQPFGVDLCSGVRRDGALSASRVEAFFHEAARCDVPAVG